MIAVLMPNRGLIFSEVLESVELMRNFQDVRTYYSEDLPIPDSFNSLVELAIQDEKMLGYELSHILFVEEDTVPPPDALERLIEADADIAFIDYGVSGWSCSARDKEGNILWCGLGCTLVKRSVFDKVPYPWFRDDQMLRLNDWKWIDTNPEKVYGGHDIWFCTQALENGCEIKQVEGECKHLKLEELGQPEVNKGLHKISTKLKIVRYQIIEKGGE